MRTQTQEIPADITPASYKYRHQPGLMKPYYLFSALENGLSGATTDLSVLDPVVHPEKIWAFLEKDKGLEPFLDTLNHANFGYAKRCGLHEDIRRFHARTGKRFTVDETVLASTTSHTYVYNLHYAQQAAFYWAGRDKNGASAEVALIADPRMILLIETIDGMTTLKLEDMIVSRAGQQIEPAFHARIEHQLKNDTTKKLIGEYIRNTFGQLPHEYHRVKWGKGACADGGPDV
ncbi:MAG: hypothetical protein Q7K43_05165 [Candidatus Woesearchaeota archaeon]|nr:hypothetical protein [Candidatus Woesearchaeota archaeon]